MVFRCTLCQEQKADSQAISIGCQHLLCQGCIVAYLDDQFVDKRRSFILTKCPVQKCDQLISYDCFKQYASPKAMQLHDIVLQTIPNDFPTTLDQFNYYYNDKGELRCKINSTWVKHK